MFDPKIVEVVARAHAAAFVRSGSDTTAAMQAALTALCAHLRITPEALNALAKGEAVVVPSAQHMTEEQAEAIALGCRVCGGIAYDAYRLGLAASPYAPQPQGGGDA